MKTKHLVYKHQKLLNNKNFRNNQNYLLSNFLESKIYNKYRKKTFIEKYYSYYLMLSFFLLFIFAELSDFYNNSKYLSFWIFLLFTTIFSPILIWILSEIFYYFKYKIYNNNFIWKKYVYRKKIRNRIYKNDYIIFKK